MPATSVQHIEQLNFEGPFGWTLAVLLGLGCAVLFAFWLQREVQILGRRKACLFWLLRTSAVGLVLWMLLAPTQVQTATATTRRAIIFVTDTSASMHTVDPVGSSDDLRWSIGANAQFNEHPLVVADRITAAVGQARHSVETAIQALRQASQEEAAQAAIISAAEACERARTLLQDLSESDTTTVARTLVDRLRESLGGPEFQDLSRLAATLKKGRIPTQTTWRDGLPDLAYRLLSVQDLLQQLSPAIATSETPGRAGMPAQNPKLSRADRIQAVMQQLQTVDFPRLSEQVDLRLFDVGTGLTTATSSTEKKSSTSGTNAAATTNLTAIFEALQQEFPDQPVAGVFVLSDFAHNHPDVADPAQVAGTLTGMPVYPIPVGNPHPVRDLELQSVFAPTVAMRNDDIVLEARVQAYDCAGEICTVQLLRDDVEIARREIPLDADFISRTVRFEEHVSLVGVHAYQVQIEPLPEEMTTENNRRDVEINVTRNDLKILIADEYPRWEYRYLTQLFRRDAQVVCDELLFHPRQVATGQRTGSRTLPVTADDWDYYDVVILGDLPTDHLPVAAQESLVEYLQQRGGTLVLIAGQNAMPASYQQLPLGEVVPVQPIAGSPDTVATDFELRVTSTGRDHPALMIADTLEESRVAWEFINQYSPLPDVSVWRQPRPTAHSLLAAVPRNRLTEANMDEQSSFLCWQPIGRGRVMYLAGPDSYRLRLLRGDRLHYRFWGQLLRWAMASDLGVGSQFVRLRTDKTRYLPRESIEITVQAQDAHGQPFVADDLIAEFTVDEVARSIPLTADPQVPGAYRARASDLAPGTYQLTVRGDSLLRLATEADPARATATIVVQPERSTELIDTRCQRVLAEQLAQATGGQVIPPTAIAEVLNLTRLDPIITTTVVKQPLWVQWKYLWIVFGCLQTEWIIRKWLGVS